MAEGRNQSYEDPHKHLRARRGARAMQVPGAGKKKEIPGNFLLCGMLVPSQKNDALWKKSKVARRAACPGTLLGIPANQWSTGIWVRGLAPTYFPGILHDWGWSRDSSHQVTQPPGHAYFPIAEAPQDNKVFFHILCCVCTATHDTDQAPKR